MAQTVSIAALALFCLSAQVSGYAHDPKHWAYDSELTPDHWADVNPTCAGSQQSPIDIDPGKAVSERFAPLFFSNYDVKAKEITLRNNGHTIVLLLKTDRTPSIADGGLIGKYNFAQLHLHWGKDSSRGSEHTIKGKEYAGEIHFVHYNTKYGNLTNALNHPDGLAVLGVFIQVGASDHPAYKAMSEVVQKVDEVDEETKLEQSVALKDLLPSNLDRFYRYSGSLTTPNCSEVVTWTVFEKPVDLSEKQLGKLRKLTDDEGHPLVDIYRPPQKLNGRTVYVRSGSAKVSIGALLFPAVLLASFLGFNVQSSF